MADKMILSDEQAAQRERDWVAWGDSLTIDPKEPTPPQRLLLRRLWAVALLLEQMGVEL